MPALSRPWLALAALVLSVTLHLSNGFYSEPTLPWLALSLVAALLGLCGFSWPWAHTGDRQSLVTHALLWVGVLVSAVALLDKPVAMYLADPRPWAHPELLVAVAIAATAVLAATRSRSPRASLLAACVLVAISLWLGAWIIRESPNPHIDVIPVHHDAFAALLRGQSPYGITFEDIYGGKEQFYAPEMRQGRRIMFGFPYPPLSLLLAWPGYALLGDLRYSEVLALAGAGAVIVWTGRLASHGGTDEGGTLESAVGLLSAAALLLAPRVVFQLEQGWTEPFPILLLAATVATALRRPPLAWLPLGLLIASKQHMLLALAFVSMLVPAPLPGIDTTSRWVRWRACATFALKAVGVAAAVTVPLALLDVDAFIRSAILLQLREPFRMDSLSFTRMLVAFGWPLDKQAAFAVSLSAGVLGLVLSWWRAPRTPAGFAASLGVTCFLLFAFGKKAFLNYYFLVVAALLIAVAAAGDTASESGDQPASLSPAASGRQTADEQRHSDADALPG